MNENIMTTIPGFPEYTIDRQANVFHQKTKSYIKPFINNATLCVKLHKNNKYIVCKLAKLLASAFIPNPNNYIYITHIDGNTFNLDIDNICWSDTSESIRNIAFEKYSPDNDYVVTIPISSIPIDYDIHKIKYAAKTHSLYKGFYWRTIKDINELCNAPITSELTYNDLYTNDIILKDLIDYALDHYTTEKQKKCIKMYFLEDYSFTEIARMLHITIEGVRQVIRSGLINLRKCKDLKDFLK